VEIVAVSPSREPLPETCRQADLCIVFGGDGTLLAAARALAGTDDDAAAARALAGGRDRVVALKRGAAGCSLFAGGERIDVGGISVEEVDPTGAGDCFNAACVLGLDAGWPMARVARFACAAGALAVTKMGPVEGAPTRAEVEALLGDVT